MIRFLPFFVVLASCVAAEQPTASVVSGVVDGIPSPMCEPNYEAASTCVHQMCAPHNQFSNPCPDADDADCDGLRDLPGLGTNLDNCVYVCNPEQANADGDRLGDACDECPLTPAFDIDNDRLCENEDNCPAHHNPGQEDADSDGFGDPCDQSP